MNFKKIDIENWARKEHYRYYTEKLKIEVNMTAPIDVKNLLDFCYIHNYKFDLVLLASFCILPSLS